MSDTREKLSKLMVEAYERCWSTMCPTCKEYDKRTADIRSNCQANLFADYLIAHGVTFADVPDTDFGKWIPVSERLPEPYITVITCRDVLGSTHKAKFVCNEHGTIDYDGDFIWSGDYKTWKTKVTHWMPLPEPPKGE